VEAREGLAPYQRSERDISLDTMQVIYILFFDPFHELNPM